MIRVIIIVEVAGCPSEHVKETLSKHIGAMNSFKDVQVHSIQISEPKEIEKSDGIFTCFAEVDFETENLSRLSELIFDFMPSSVEILEPARVSFTSQEASSFLNNISGRMHRYDEVAQVAISRMKQMEAQLKVYQENDLKKETKKEKPKKKKKDKN